MSRCQECRGGARRGHTTLSGRRLCEECYRNHAAFVGAGSAMVGGAGVGESVVQGVATRGYAGAFTGEAAAARARRAKLDRTQGVLRRMWVRVVG